MSKFSLAAAAAALSKSSALGSSLLSSL